MAQEYHGAHQAPTDDGYCNPIANLEKSFGPDVYEHPEFYGSGQCDDETMLQLLAARDTPEATVRIYRAAPHGVGEINRGDWITLSCEYAEQHAIQDGTKEHDWPIISTVVPASTVFTDGNDLAEYGYDGPQLTALNADAANQDSVIKHVPAPQASPAKTPTPKSPWADHTPEYFAASQALIDGTARAKLRAGFTASGLSIAEVAARVGHSERVAGRVIAGDEYLGESAVAAYFKAMGVDPGPAAVDAWEAEQETLRRLAG